MSDVTRRWDVLGLGSVAVDDLVYVDQYPPPDTKVSILRSARQCGGLTATALAAAARLGSRCAYAGVLGDDELSGYALQQMRQEGIDLTWARQRAEASVIHSFIVVDVKNRSRNIFANHHGFVGAAIDWPPEEVILSARVLFVDHLNPPGMKRAARLAKESGVALVADFERVSGPDFPVLLGLIDHLIVSHPFARNFTGERDPSQAVAKLWGEGRKAAIVTCGNEGCWYMTEANPGCAAHCPAFPVEAADTTGCGDVFHGAYAAGLARGWDTPACVRFASAAAALKATKTGGHAGLPRLDEVETFIQQGGPETE